MPTEHPVACEAGPPPQPVRKRGDCAPAGKRRISLVATDVDRLSRRKTADHVQEQRSGGPVARVPTDLTNVKHDVASFHSPPLDEGEHLLAVDTGVVLA